MSNFPHGISSKSFLILFLESFKLNSHQAFVPRNIFLIRSSNFFMSLELFQNQIQQNSAPITILFGSDARALSPKRWKGLMVIHFFRWQFEPISQHHMYSQHQSASHLPWEKSEIKKQCNYFSSPRTTIEIRI